eukprot:TRINITY_DN21935_c0_g1_i1.p1 TRINITY_DN21935_c0_g1~~TRINITY_DN21935_c0_g1_i1.p1  ORF type:complete len:168 (-),score=13.63 TRINITY_DN21935_c0_g1_i1:29-532(-)
MHPVSAPAAPLLSHPELGEPTGLQDVPGITEPDVQEKEAGTAEPLFPIVILKPDHSQAAGTREVSNITTPRGIYSGMLKDGKPHGQGDMLFVDGTRYTGAWWDGYQHGEGAFTASNFHYKGGWKHGQYHGHGKFAIKGAYKYVGALVEGNMTGEGVMMYDDGRKHDW